MSKIVRFTLDLPLELYKELGELKVRLRSRSLADAARFAIRTALNKERERERLQGATTGPGAAP